MAGDRAIRGLCFENGSVLVNLIEYWDFPLKSSEKFL
jgi:hypothetical protein